MVAITIRTITVVSTIAIVPTDGPHIVEGHGPLFHRADVHDLHIPGGVPLREDTIRVDVALADDPGVDRIATAVDQLIVLQIPKHCAPRKASWMIWP